MDTKQRGVELGKEGHMGERKRGREGGGSEGGREGEGGRCHVPCVVECSPSENRSFVLC